MRKLNASILTRLYLSSVKKTSFFILTLFFSVSAISQQTTLTTTYANNNGNGMISFNLENTNAYPVLITDIASVVSISGSVGVQAWYNLTPVNSTTAPPAVTAANGWTQFGSATITGVSNTTTTVSQPFLTGLSLVIPAGATYGIVVGASNGTTGYLRYSSLTPGLYTTSGGGVNLITGTNIGWAGGAIPAAFANNDRGFIGSITFEPAGPCTNPPIPGSIVSTSNPACASSNFTLSLTGGTGGTGQSYQWLSSTDNVTYSPIASATSAALTTNQTTTTYYKVAVTCGVTVTSSPILVTTPPLISGNFTINKNLATSGSNFNSFADALNYIKCGINGPVKFTVTPGTGPYNEQVIIPQIAGVSAANRITFKGSMETVSFASTTSTQRAVFTLDGADYVTIDSLLIDASAGTYGWGVLMTNQANNNTISNSTITVSTTNTTSVSHAPVVISGSTSSPTTSGNNGNSNTITNNILTGGYYGVVLYGNSAAGLQNTNNTVSNNTIQDTYGYAIYSAYQSGVVISSNDISRPTRASSTTTAGVFLTTGNIGALVEKNRIHNMFDQLATSTSTIYGVYVAADGTLAQPNKIVNNLIYNIAGNGTQYGIYNTTAPYMQAYHNTIVLDDQATTTGAAYGFYQTGSTTGIQFMNNIVYITRAGTGIKRALLFNTAASSIVSNNNDLFLNSLTGTNNHLGQWNAINFTTLNDWKTANSNAYDQLSLSVDPLFLNPSAGNFRPTEMLLNNIGANVGVTTDITNAARNVASPDPGAYEFNGPPCVNPAVAGSAQSSTSTVCSGAPFVLSLNGNSLGDGISIQWQFSPDNISWTNLGTASSASTINHTQTTSTYYRAGVSCSGGAVAYSTSVFVSTPPLVSGNFTINSSLSTGGTNFQTFTDAVNYMSCGINGPVKFTVAPGSGPYDEQIVIPQISGASATNTITFKGNLATLSFNSTVTTNRAGIILNGADFIIIDSLIVDASAGTYGWGIVLTNQADSNIISNSTIITNATSTSSNYVGIAINGSATGTAVSGNNGNGNLIIGNTVIGGYYGIYVYGSTTPYNTGNVIKNNNVQESYIYSMYLYGNTNLTVSGNDISRPTRTSVSTGYGIYLSTTTSALVEKNRIHDLFGGAPTSTSSAYPIYVAGSGTSVAAPNRAENNLIYNINNGGGLIYGIYGAGYNNWNYYHNTIVLDDASATAGTTYGMYVYGTGVNVKNNIVYITRGGTGTKYNLYYSTTGVAASNNNVLYNNAAAGTNGIGYYNAGYATLAAWQAANGGVYDQQSISVDPMFANPSSGDFRPTEPSIMFAGANVGVATDILGVTRVLANPTPGAYEILPPTGIDLGVKRLISPVAQQCVSTPQTVSVKIRNYSSTTHDFAANPVTVSVSVNGNPLTPVVVNSGTLAFNDSLTVVITNSFNMSVPGTYSFTASTSVTGDVNAGNNAMAATDVTIPPLDAGTASSTASMYCITGGTPTLKLTGMTGFAGIQWLEATNAAGPWANVGTNSATYTPSSPIAATSYYKAIVSCGLNADTSNTVTVSIFNPQVLTTTADTSCGTGPVDLHATASAGATLNWYAAASGGLPIGSGGTFTTTVSSTTNFYVEANQGGTGGASPIQVTEMDLGGNDQLEIQNVSGAAVDVTGWKIAISDSYTSITAVNANVQTLSGMMNPGETKTWTDLASAPNYWGSNMFWNPGAFPTYAGWAAILDNNNNLVDIVFLNWPAANIQGASINIGTSTITVGSQWSGNGIDITSVSAAQSVSRQGNLDTHNASDFAITNLSIGSTNPGMSLPFAGFGCQSPRTMVTATVLSPATITTQPVSQNVCAGANVTFTVAATGQAPLTYQWKKNGVNITGATSATLTLNAVSTADTANYTVTVTGCNSVTSTAAALTLNAGPAISTQPASVAVCAGANVMFKVVATGTGLTYQWKKAGVNISAATADSLKINGVTTADTAGYTVVVTNSCGSVTSAIAYLSITAPAAITTQPSNQAVCYGQSATFTVVAGGAGLTYQWRKNGVAITGATNASYTFTPLVPADTASYTVVVTGTCGSSVTSSAVAIVPNAPTVVTAQPSSQTICALNTATFNVTATGTGTLTYQWRKNGVAIAGATTASYSIVNAAVGDAGNYDVKVTGACGSDSSVVVVLTVNACTAVPAIDADVSSAVLMPNVAHNKTRLEIVVRRTMKIDWIVTDAKGNVVMKFTRTAMAGKNSFDIQLHQLAAGSYQVTGTSLNRKVATLRLIKQ
jgi:metal-sulfur cluster biosynthetic enzyme